MRFESFSFGSIRIDGVTYTHDVVIDRGQVRKRKKKLLVSFDWTEFRRFHTLMAAACIKGRSVPLLWASYKEWKFLRSQNSLEEGLLRLLRTLIPRSVRVVILADRGFYERRTRDVEPAAFRHQYLVRHHREIRAARNTAPHNGRNLRNPLRRQPGVVPEDAPKIVLIGKNLVLQWEENSRGINQINEGQVVVH